MRLRDPEIDVGRSSLLDGEFNFRTIGAGLVSIRALLDVENPVSVQHPGSLTATAQWHASGPKTIFQVSRPMETFPTSKLVEIWPGL